MWYTLLTVNVLVLLLCSNCNKSEFLSASPSSNYIAPANLTHLFGLLNNEHLMGESPVVGEQSADDYYLLDDYYAALPQIDKNLYTWEKEIFGSSTNIPDWNTSYSQVLTCNVVLESLANIKPGAATQKDWDRIKGAALFMRSYAFYNIAQVFAAPYHSATARQDQGIVLSLNTATDVIYSRSTMQESYDQIITDLLTATSLLPAEFDTGSRNIPGKPAALAMLARVYLSIRDYARAGAYADSCLQCYNRLIDFNTLNLNEKYPVPKLNAETLYQSCMFTNNVLQGRVIAGAAVDSALFAAYHENDLRKKVFFMVNTSGLPLFRSSYSGTALPFSGLAVDEMYLIRAECSAIKGDLPSAIADINHLLEKRFKTGTFQPYTTGSTEAEVLRLVRLERRKELVYRGLRWTDLKRLNKEEANITIRRTIANRQYELLPNDSRYALPIPVDALMNSNIEQNQR